MENDLFPYPIPPYDFIPDDEKTFFSVSYIETKFCIKNLIVI
jgi:hypothetical protein